MKRNLTALVLALVLTPALGAAMCSRDHEQAMNCADGTVFDATSGTCVPQASS